MLFQILALFMWVGIIAHNLSDGLMPSETNFTG